MSRHWVVVSEKEFGQDCLKLARWGSRKEHKIRALSSLGLRGRRNSAYHYGMQVLGWTLVFTSASLEHLAEREVDADVVAYSIFGHYCLGRVRRSGRGHYSSWYLSAPHILGTIQA